MTASMFVRTTTVCLRNEPNPMKPTKSHFVRLSNGFAEPVAAAGLVTRGCRDAR